MMVVQGSYDLIGLWPLLYGENLSVISTKLWDRIIIPTDVPAISAMQPQLTNEFITVKSPYFEGQWTHIFNLNKTLKKFVDHSKEVKATKCWPCSYYESLNANLRLVLLIWVSKSLCDA